MTYRIAVLDTETYSLKINAAFAEAALVCVDIKHKGYYENIPDDPFENDGTRILKHTFPLLEQIALGRSVDPDTIKFHTKNQNKDYLGNLLFEDADLNPLSCRDILQSMSDFVRNNDIHEVWMNHTNFDTPRLTSLAEQLDFKLWNFRKDIDLWPFRCIFNIKPAMDTGPVAHRAMQDAAWGLSIVKGIGHFIRDNVKDTTGFRKPFPVLSDTVRPMFADVRPTDQPAEDQKGA